MASSTHNRLLIIVVWALVLLSLLAVYKFISPELAPAYFPKCPFRQYTGLQCPGCGSQRALHHLLNFRLGAAFALNPLLVLSIPYLLLGFWLDATRPLKGKWLVVRRTLYGRVAILVCLVVVLLFWAGRNIPIVASWLNS